jgi:catechol 2,3-dioxygenase-like lactoylglutathione lyase family enzyme
VLTGIDHLMICVRDLEEGRAAYARMGFNVHPGGVHPGRGTHNAIAFFERDYLEVMGVRDRAEYVAAAGAGGGLLEFLERGGGLRYIAVQSDDLDADVAAMRRRGVEVTDPGEGGRRTPGGVELRWKSSRLGAADELPIFFIQHLTPLAERRKQAPGAGEHPNGVTALERVYIVVPDVAAAVGTYSRVLGMPAPKIQRGSVIKADMAVFDIGPSGLTVAQPAEPGPAAQALARRGPGPFQALYRTRSMERASRHLADHGLPPPTRGIRNTGEQAMLVDPAHACGVFIGFVGPA